MVPGMYDTSIIFNCTSLISSRLDTPKHVVYYMHWLHKLLSCLKLYVSNLNSNIKSGGPWSTCKNIEAKYLMSALRMVAFHQILGLYEEFLLDSVIWVP